MKSVASTYDTRRVFQEDGQTFYLTQAERDGSYHPKNCWAGEAYCNGGWYDSMPLQSARWGERHRLWETSSYAYLPGKPGYRGTTHESTLGAALVVRLLSIENLWNHDPFLDWQKNMVNEGVSGTWGSNFARDMWSKYYTPPSGAKKPDSPSDLTLKPN
jgi:hypothetical protein